MNYHDRELKRHLLIISQLRTEVATLKRYCCLACNELINVAGPPIIVDYNHSAKRIGDIMLERAQNASKSIRRLNREIIDNKPNITSKGKSND